MFIVHSLARVINKFKQYMYDNISITLMYNMSHTFTYKNVFPTKNSTTSHILAYVILCLPVYVDQIFQLNIM